LTHTRSLFTHICNTDDDQTTVQYTREEWRGLHTWNTDNDVMLQSKETYYSVKRDPLQFADFWKCWAACQRGFASGHFWQRQGV